MSVQQAHKVSHEITDHDSAVKRSCMAILWVQGHPSEINKPGLLEAVRKLTGVTGVTFARDKPAILAIDYSARETRATKLVEAVRRLGASAKIVGC